MAFRSGHQARIYIGSLPASAYTRTLSSSYSQNYHDTTVLTSDAREFIIGLGTSTFSIEGPLDTTTGTGTQKDVLDAQIAAQTAVPITYLPVGATDGGLWMIDGHHTQFDTMAGVDSSVNWSLASQGTGLTDKNGVVLEDNTTVTIDTDGSDVAGPVGGSANGGVAHLHVTAFSGFTSDDIIIEGSTSGAFAGEETTVVTFTQVAGLTAERVEVTGTVPRYLRVVDDVTGTGSITRFVSFARR